MSRFSLLALAVCILSLPVAAQGRWLDTFAVPGTAGGGLSGTSVSAIAPDGPGALIGGEFRVVDDAEANSVARWTGERWETFGGGLRCTACFGSGPVAARVQAVIRDAAGAVWVAGLFDTAVQPDGTELTVSGLARWTGAAWDAPGALGTGAFGTPIGYALLVQGASVVVAGDFSDVRRPDGTLVGAANVARWTGGVWEPLSQGSTVYALAAGTDGRILSAGYVATPDGGSGLTVQAWTGAMWQTVTGLLDGPFPFVRALLVDGPGLVVGGGFAGGQTADGVLVPSRNVVRWDGAAWQPLGQGVAGVEVRALARDGAGLLVGGIVYGGIDASGATVPARGLVRWTGAAWQAVPDVGGGVVDALSAAGSETRVGGLFRVQRGQGAETVRAVNLAVVAPGGAARPLSAWTGRDGTFVTDGTG